MKTTSIYRNESISKEYDKIIRPMFEEMYYKLLDDVRSKNKQSYIFKHHIKLVQNHLKWYSGSNYENEEPNLIVADYIASMTDDYFIALHKEMFPNSDYQIVYKSYFK